MIDDLAVLVSRPGTMHGSTKAFDANRVCECCTTVLSRYNPSPWCSIHEGAERKIRRLFGGLMPHGSVLIDIEFCTERPLFRCDVCEHAWPIAHQWRTDDQRFCPWHRPSDAIRSDALELAS